MPETRYLGLEHIEQGGRIIGYETVGGAQLVSTKFRFSPEHVLFGKLRPNLGKISRPEFEGVCSTDIIPIRPGKHLDRNYLAHFLLQPSMIDYAASRTSGANLPRLSPDLLAKFLIPLPSLSEQRRIAAILDQADALRSRRRQVLNHLATLTGSVFHDTFGGHTYKTLRLDEVAAVSSGITKGRKTNESTTPTPYLAVSNVQAGCIKLDLVKEIPATSAEIQRYALQDGDLVLTEGGDPDKLGRGTVWRSQLALCLHQNHVFKVRPDKHIVLPDYLSECLASSESRAYFLRSAKQTTGIASINMTQLRAAPVPMPPMRDQLRFLERKMSIASKHAALQHIMATHDELFASLQSRAFRGEL
ncbi:restriction endonuclease subunit S [Segniliparus rugosus]|uniref:restriction endonuclease subunit S n=1 Tax=Segniliparus rugosus TaxID=286804 RepID=UPI00146FC481|nr:restriction endonuclease subunit S [Segniliparus rugosus]